MATNLQQRRQLPENKPSNLLSKEENDIIFALLGKKCNTLSTAVVQLLLTEGPYHTKWQIRCTGVVCFVKDNPKRSYFIRVFDFDKRCLVWEQELYTTFEYKTPRPFFHTFEAHDCMAGLNFANEMEAIQFKNAISEKLSIRHQKRQERKLQQQQIPQPTHAGVSLSVPASANRSQSLTSLQNQNAGKKGKKDKRKQKLTKEDIGAPSNFQHVQHIGWNPNTGFDLENVDPNLIKFFEVAGVSQEQLTDQDTRTFIYDFIDRHGGIDAAIQEVKRPPPSKPSVPPVSSLPPPIHSSIAPQPPPPPSRSPHKLTAPPVPSMPSVAPPPPPPPLPTSAPTAVPPPPPPPPPMPSSAPAPPPMPSAKATPAPQPVANDTRSALMDQIKKGKALNHVEPDSESVKSNTSNDDPRNALMNQIRQGVGLRSVETNAGKADRKSNPAEVGGLAGALARALQERARAIGQTDESDNNSESDEDEWED